MVLLYDRNVDLKSYLSKRTIVVCLSSKSLVFFSLLLFVRYVLYAGLLCRRDLNDPDSRFVSLKQKASYIIAAFSAGAV